MQTSSKMQMPRILPTPLYYNKNVELLLPDWHVNFLRLATNHDMEKMERVLACASFLEVHSLIRLVSARIGSMLQMARSTTRLRDILNIENDYTKEEEHMLSTGKIGIWDSLEEEEERKLKERKKEEERLE